MSYTLSFYESLTPARMGRFFSKVMPEPNSGCHLWDGATSKDGYGKMRFLGAARDVDGFALHSCDNPACVNADHLREGTNSENTRDRVSRGRSARQRGTLNGRAKLTESDVKDIRALGDSVAKAAIGRRYGVGKSIISDIILRRRWSHL